MEEVFHRYAHFDKGTGSKLNVKKCEGLSLGGWRGRPDRTLPFQWTSNKLRVLGTFIGNGCMEEANWRPRVDAVTNCVSAWSGRRLSCGGKALVCNALALARVRYMATMFPIPGWALAELNRTIFSCRGKIDQVARAVVIRPLSCGGFGLVSVRLKSQALLVQWVRLVTVGETEYGVSDEKTMGGTELKEELTVAVALANALHSQHDKWSLPTQALKSPRRMSLSDLGTVDTALLRSS